MDVEVVQHQLDDPGLRELQGQMEGHIFERERLAIRRVEGMVSA